MSVNQSYSGPQPPVTGGEFSCVSLAPGPGVAGLRLSGELDLATAPRLGEALSSVGDAAVVILDLSRLTFMDSSGLHTILIGHARLSETGRRLVVVPGPPAVQRIFELTGTTRVLEFGALPDASDQQSSNPPSRDGTNGSRPYAMTGPAAPGQNDGRGSLT